MVDGKNSVGNIGYVRLESVRFATSHYDLHGDYTWPWRALHGTPHPMLQLPFFHVWRVRHDPGWILSPLSLHSQSGPHGKSELFLMPIGTTTSARYPRSFHCWYDLFRHSSPCLAHLEVSCRNAHFHSWSSEFCVSVGCLYLASGGLHPEKQHPPQRVECLRCPERNPFTASCQIWTRKSRAAHVFDRTHT